MIEKDERGNAFTHLVGVVFALTSIWMISPAVHRGWEWAMGVLFFIVGMFLMFLSSTLYHWAPRGKLKNALRVCDHISIYVMIACSYTPICIALVGGWFGWLSFAFLWSVVIFGAVYKIVALGKNPKLSLTLYLVMGWSVVFIAKPVFERLTPLAALLLFAEGLFYTIGTYFFAHDDRKNYHAVWHIFVFFGALAHWSVILVLLLD